MSDYRHLHLPCLLRHDRDRLQYLFVQTDTSGHSILRPNSEPGIFKRKLCSQSRVRSQRSLIPKWMLIWKIARLHCCVPAYIFIKVLPALIFNTCHLLSCFWALVLFHHSHLSSTLHLDNPGLSDVTIYFRSLADFLFQTAARHSPRIFGWHDLHAMPSARLVSFSQSLTTDQTRLAPRPQNQNWSVSGQAEVTTLPPEVGRSWQSWMQYGKNPVFLWGRLHSLCGKASHSTGWVLAFHLCTQA